MTKEKHLSRKPSADSGIGNRSRNPLYILRAMLFKEPPPMDCAAENLPRDSDPESKSMHSFHSPNPSKPETNIT